MRDAHGQTSTTIRLAEAETPFPVLTQEVRPGAATGSGDGDLGRLAAQTISDVLGWRPRGEDADGFVAALAGSFEIKRVEGHNEAVWTPRGYAVQADLGLVTGGQASLAARARTTMRDALPLLDALVPLRVEPDVQDAEAFRSLVRHELEELLKELESPVIRSERVDELFDQLTGGQTFAGNPVRVTAAAVAGHLGELREQLGLTRENVNTIEEERIQTSFHTLADWILSLESSWHEQKGEISLADGAAGFLGTTLVRLSQEFAAVSAQVEEVWAALDSVFITVGERQTIRLDSKSSLSLEGMLTWLHEFFTFEGKKIIQSSGKDGLERAVTPVLIRLERLVLDNLVRKLPTPLGQITLQVTGDAVKPPGFYSARVQLAVYELHNYIQQARKTAQRVHRNFEVSISHAEPNVLEPRSHTITVHGSGFQPGVHTAVILVPGRNDFLAPLEPATPLAGDTPDLLRFEFDLTEVGYQGPCELAVYNTKDFEQQGVQSGQRPTLLDFTHVFVQGHPGGPRDSALEPGTGVRIRNVEPRTLPPTRPSWATVHGQGLGDHSLNVSLRSPRGDVIRGSWEPRAGRAKSAVRFDDLTTVPAGDYQLVIEREGEQLTSSPVRVRDKNGSPLRGTHRTASGADASPGPSVTVEQTLLAGTDLIRLDMEAEGIDDSCTVRLEGGEPRTVVEGNVEWNRDGVNIATFDLSRAPEGVYELQVLSDGQTVASDAPLILQRDPGEEQSTHSAQ
ncbi:hypothetical protein [Streptomyces sp. NPDC096030]|uniref:hypothetical protein n=1 Tax=Streptomyces sp. NPDC096030 TaxID=3155423 RepID=UPI00331F4B08